MVIDEILTAIICMLVFVIIALVAKVIILSIALIIVINKPSKDNNKNTSVNWPV